MEDNLFSSIPITQAEGTVFDDVVAPNEAPPGTPALPNKTLLMALSQVNTNSNPSLQMQGDAIEAATSTIETGQEMTVRNKIAANRAINQLANLNKYRMGPASGLITPEQSAAIEQSYQNVLAWDHEQKARTAMEEQAIENIEDMAARDPVQAQVLMDNFEHGGAEQVRHNALVRQTILAQRAEELDNEYQSSGWGMAILNGILNLVPTNYNFQRTGIVEGADTGVLDWIFSGDATRKQAERMNEMSIEEFAEFASSNGELMKAIRSNATTLFGLTNDPGAAVHLLKGLSGQAEDDRFWASTWGAVEVGMVVPVRSVVGITKNLIRAGARKESVDQLMKAAETLEREGAEAMVAKTAVTPEELRQGQSISMVAPEVSSPNSVPVAMDLAAREDAAREALGRLPGIIQETERLGPDGLMQAYEDVVEQVMTDVGRPIKDVAMKTETVANGNTLSYVEFVFGRTNGGGFAKEGTAVNAARDKGVIGEAFRDESGQWFVRGRVNIPETGFHTNELHNPTQGFVSHLTGRWIRSAARTTDYGLHGKAVQAGSTIARQQKIIAATLDKAFKSIPQHSQDVVRQIGLVGANKARWWSDAEFNSLVERQWKRPATEGELKAYKDLQLYNDMDWVLRNDQMYLEKAVRGVEKIETRATWGQQFEIEGVVNYKPSIKPKERFYNISDNVHYTEQLNPITPAELERLANEGYVIVKSEKAIRLPDGTTVNQIIGRRTDFQIGPLSRTQLAYSPGGHRLYENGSYFVKQASVGKQADTGTEFLDNPNVFVTAVNKAEGQAWADAMNRARVAVAEHNWTGQMLDDEIFKGSQAFPTGKEFVEKIESGFINKDHPFEALFDREQPSLYNKSGPGISSFVNEDELGYNGYYRTTGKLYTSSKGEILKDTAGDIAVTVDPYEALATSLKSITRQSGLFNYKTEGLERFVKSFESDLNIPADAKNNYTKFVNSTVKPGISLDRKNFIEAQRTAMKNVLGFESPFEKGMKESWRHAAEQILGDGSSAGRKAVHDTINWWSTSNPVSFLRGIAFDSKLGMFNVGQFFIQSATMASAVALSPAHGIKGLMTAMPLHGYLLSKGSETMLDTLAKRGVGKLAGFASETEFKEYARSIHRSGFMDMDGSHVMVGDHGTVATFGSFGERVHKAREAGRTFFYMAETYNRLVAYRIAWAEALESGVKVGSPGFYGKVAARADDYSMNMTHASAARWQQGLMSIPTQFWAYNARMMDAMIGKRFSATQKMRLIGMNFALGGVAGLPVVEGLYSMYKDNYGVDNPIDTLAGTLDRGVLDKLAYEVTGADVRIGEKVGTGGWLTGVLRDAFGQGEYGEKSWAEMMGGATFSILKNAGGVALDVFKYSTAESGGDMGEDAIRNEEWLKLASEISTFGNISKAILAHNYGIYKSTKGTIYPDIPEADAFYIALGFKPQQIDTLGHMMEYTKNQDQVVKDATNQLKKWRQEAFFNEDKMDVNMRKANALVRMLPANIRAKVIKEANGDTGTLFEHIEKKFNQQQAEAAALEGTE